MKLQNKYKFSLSTLNTADVAYLLLIFIIIMSLICTDKIYGVKLPYSKSDKLPTKESIRVVVVHNEENIFFVVDNIEYDNMSFYDLLSKYEPQTEFIVVADKQESAKNVKMLLKIMQDCDKYNVAFMCE